MASQLPHHDSIIMATKNYWHQPRQRGAHGSISDMLRYSDQTRSKIDRLEKALSNGDKGRYDNKILKEFLTKTQDALAKRTTDLRETQTALGELREMREAKEVSDSLLGFARQVIEQKNAEIQQLQAQVEKSDSANSELNEQLRRIGLASADEATNLAMDVCAKRTLNMLQGYKKGISERDAKIRALERNVEAAEKNKSMEREVEVAKQQLREYDDKVSGLEKELVFANQQAAELGTIANEQKELIDRLFGREQYRGVGH